MLSVLVQRIKQLNIIKKNRSFKIHIVVMFKDDAAAVCEALSAESISCLMLTSDCLQSKKEDTMLAWAWEERNEQCMVSNMLMELIMERSKMSLYTGQAICFN